MYIYIYKSDFALVWLNYGRYVGDYLSLDRWLRLKRERERKEERPVIWAPSPIGLILCYARPLVFSFTFHSGAAAFEKKKKGKKDKISCAFPRLFTGETHNYESAVHFDLQPQDVTEEFFFSPPLVNGWLRTRKPNSGRVMRLVGMSGHRIPVACQTTN